MWVRLDPECERTHGRLAQGRRRRREAIALVETEQLALAVPRWNKERLGRHVHLDALTQRGHHIHVVDHPWQSGGTFRPAGLGRSALALEQIRVDQQGAIPLLDPDKIGRAMLLVIVDDLPVPWHGLLLIVICLRHGDGQPCTAIWMCVGEWLRGVGESSH